MSQPIKLLDVVVLLRDHGDWPAGTSGTIVEAFEDAAFVELVGPDGRTLDILTVPYEDLRLLDSGADSVAV
jgi:hypothetical protein